MDKLAALIVEGPDGFVPTDDVEGMSPILWIITAMRGVGIERVVIAGDTSMRYIERFCTKQLTEFIYPTAGDGYFASAIKHLSTRCERVMIVPANYPLVNLATIKLLADSDESNVCPSYNGVRGYPICVSIEYLSGLSENENSLDFIHGNSAVIETTDSGVTTNVADGSTDTGKVVSDMELRRTLRPVAKVAISFESSFFGPGVLQMLKLIDETGSIRRTCKLMGMATSRARKLIANIEANLGFEITIHDDKVPPFGWTTVTPECKRFIEQYEKFAAACDRSIETEFKNYFNEFKNVK